MKCCVCHLPLFEWLVAITTTSNHIYDNYAGKSAILQIYVLGLWLALGLGLGFADLPLSISYSLRVNHRFTSTTDLVFNKSWKVFILNHIQVLVKFAVYYIFNIRGI